MNGLKKMMRENPEKGREEAIQIIKNTYRVLMSRGMKGCYVYCSDKALSDYLKMRLQRCQRNDLYVKDVDAVIEAGELLECFQWSDDDYDIEHVKEELADVLVYCQDMADKLDVDIDEIVNLKMDQNEAKYPVEKAKGNAKKYDVF